MFELNAAIIQLKIKLFLLVYEAGKTTINDQVGWRGGRVKRFCEIKVDSVDCGLFVKPSGRSTRDEAMLPAASWESWNK